MQQRGFLRSLRQRLPLRVHDVLRVIDWALAHGATEVRLAGKGLGSVLATFAAFLHPSRPRLVLLDRLPSFKALVSSPLMLWPLSSIPRGALGSFDLPDIYAALGRRLEMDARMRPERPSARVQT